VIRIVFRYRPREDIHLVFLLLFGRSAGVHHDVHLGPNFPGEKFDDAVRSLFARVGWVRTNCRTIYGRLSVSIIKRRDRQMPFGSLNLHIIRTNASEKYLVAVETFFDRYSGGSVSHVQRLRRLPLRTPACI